MLAFPSADSASRLFFWGLLRCGFALRRYALGLAGLLGPSQASPPWSSLTATPPHR